MADSRSDTCSSAKGLVLLLFETMAAKEAKDGPGCMGKPLGCSCLRFWEDCSAELSGSPVLRGVTPQTVVSRDTADLATGRYRRGKSYRT